MAQYRQLKWYGEAGGDPVSLGDAKASDGIVQPTPPQQERSAEVQQFYEGKFGKGIDYGTRVNTYTWQVERVHANADAARLFSRLHNDDIDTAGILEDGGEGFTPVYMVDAIITARCVFIEGATTKFEYTVRGGKWTVTNPLIS